MIRAYRMTYSFKICMFITCRLVHMSQASLLEPGLALCSFGIFLKLHSYGSGPTQLGDIPPLPSSYGRIKRANPARHRARNGETTLVHVSCVKFKMENK